MAVLKARVGGAWVPVSSPPVTSGMIVAHRPASLNFAATTSTELFNLVFTPQAGFTYKLIGLIRAVACYTATPSHGRITILVNGAAVSTASGGDIYFALTAPDGHYASPPTIEYLFASSELTNGVANTVSIMGWHAAGTRTWWPTVAWIEAVGVGSTGPPGPPSAMVGSTPIVAPAAPYVLTAGFGIASGNTLVPAMPNTTQVSVTCSVRINSGAEGEGWIYIFGQHHNTGGSPYTPAMIGYCRPNSGTTVPLSWWFTQAAGSGTTVQILAQSATPAVTYTIPVDGMIGHVSWICNL